MYVNTIICNNYAVATFITDKDVLASSNEVYKQVQNKLKELSFKELHNHSYEKKFLPLKLEFSHYYSEACRPSWRDYNNQLEEFSELDYPIKMFINNLIDILIASVSDDSVPKLLKKLHKLV